MTDIQDALEQASRLLTTTSDSARLDAEVLLCHVLNKPRSHLRAWPEKPLQTQEEAQFRQLLTKRQQGLPIAYLTGNKEFWSREFTVNADVLIPRPDTELLIELSLQLIHSNKVNRIIDLGTGSGIIAITLAAEQPQLEVWAADMSEKALQLASLNAKKHHTEHIKFIHSDWFSRIPSGKFDLVISNPPYIDCEDIHLSQGDVRFEPDSALIAAEQGLKDIQTICHDARSYLNKDATLLIEHGFDQQEAVQTIFQTFAYQNITSYNDLSGNPRVTTGQWPS